MYELISINSILSLSAAGIFLASFAVATKIIWLKSIEKLRYKSLNSLFCSGSKTSSITAVGSPLCEAPTLSISSNTTTGFIVLASFKPLTIRPGIAPT